MEENSSIVEVACIKAGCEETEMFPRGHEPKRFICGLCQAAYKKTQGEQEEGPWFETKKDGRINKVKK